MRSLEITDKNVKDWLGGLIFWFHANLYRPDDIKWIVKNSEEGYQYTHALLTYILENRPISLKEFGDATDFFNEEDDIEDVYQLIQDLYDYAFNDLPKDQIGAKVWPRDRPRIPIKGIDF